MTYFLFTVDMFSFFITLMFVYFQQILHCFIIYSYKTNPSFLPCPCNSRSIWPSDFNWCFTLYRQYFSHIHRQNSTIIWPGATNEFDTVATCGEKQVGDSEDASLDRERSTIIWLKSDPLLRYRTGDLTTPHYWLCSSERRMNFVVCIWRHDFNQSDSVIQTQWW